MARAAMALAWGFREVDGLPASYYVVINPTRLRRDEYVSCPDDASGRIMLRSAAAYLCTEWQYDAALASRRINCRQHRARSLRQK
jgi:hypothetical protein